VRRPVAYDLVAHLSCPHSSGRKRFSAFLRAISVPISREATVSIRPRSDGLRREDKPPPTPPPWASTVQKMPVHREKESASSSDWRRWLPIRDAVSARFLFDLLGATDALGWPDSDCSPTIRSSPASLKAATAQRPFQRSVVVSSPELDARWWLREQPHSRSRSPEAFSSLRIKLGLTHELVTRQIIQNPKDQRTWEIHLFRQPCC
jgi:hypothetical protein